MTQFSTVIRTLLIVLVFSLTGCTSETSTYGDLYITAGHLGEVEGYELLYVDKERDVAYYLPEDRILTIIKEQPAKLDGFDSAVVSNPTPGSFDLQVEPPTAIRGGLSGERVYSSNGDVLGFVVAVKSYGVLDCRTLE